MITCPELSIVQAFVERVATDAEQKLLRAHLEGCASCRAVVLTLAAETPETEQTETQPELAHPFQITVEIGQQIGRYVVLRKIGQGGMGVVYAAYDPDLDRTIALKLIGAAERVPAEDVQERLLREGKSLARVAHRNVIAVYDIGRQADRVFVAMELIDGETLGSWLSREPRSNGQIVEVFIEAGRGLAAAHAAGLVHRDFKPNNVMIDRRGNVRVMDFGLARPLDAPLAIPGEMPSPPGSTDGSLAVSQALVGTPAYMAPEQMAREKVEARTDQFSFCVALYEALYRERPYAGSTLYQTHQAITASEVRPPPRGSKVPVWLREALLRGLRSRVEDRFPTMRELLETLARDPAPRRKKRVGIALAALGIAAVAFAAAARLRDQRLVCEGGARKLESAWNPERKEAINQALRASGKSWAGETAAIVSREIDRYGEEWVGMYRAACEATSVRHEQSAALLDLRMQCLNEKLEEVRALAGLLSQPDPKLLVSAPKAVFALTPLRACADTKALLAPVPPPADPAVRAQVEEVRAGITDAKAMIDLGRYAEAERRGSELTARAKALRYPPLEAAALEVTADSLEYLNDFPRAVDSYREALLAAERGGDRKRAASALVDLVWTVGADQGLFRPADEYAAHASAILAGLGGDLVLEGDLTSYQAALLRDEGKPGAEKLGREALEKRRLSYGKEHPRYAMALNNLAAYVGDEHRFTETLALEPEALAINARTLGEHHPDYALSLQGTADALKELGRYAEARRLIEQALSITRDQFGPEHTRTAGAEEALALIEGRLGETADAERHLRQALSAVEKLQGPNHFMVAIYSCQLGDLLLQEGRSAEAVSIYQTALAILAKRPFAAENAYAQTGLAVALLGVARPAEALPLLETDLQWQEKNQGNARDLARTRLGLSRALASTGGDRRRARELARLALDAYASDPGTALELSEAKAWRQTLGDD